MRPKVVVAEPIAAAGLEALARDCDVDVAVDAGREDLLGRVAGADALVVRSGTNVDAELIAAGRRLRVIGRAGIGTDNIDLEAATRAGILVVNAPQANVISAAEHTMALLLAQARNVAAADATLRGGTWDRKRFQGVELHGKVLGVVGLGRIGTLVAQRASAFGMRIVAFDPYVAPERARRLGIELVARIDELLADADFVTVHLPLTRETEGLIGGEALARVKPGVRIVNTSRGGVVDEEALAAAIGDGRVAGAALDVFAAEPITDSPLFGMPQVVVTPHLGASTREAQDKAGTDVAGAVAAALRGELVTAAVNVDMGPDVSDEVKPYLPLAEALGRAFVVLSQGLPNQLAVRAEGRLADHPVRPLALAVLKGALSAVSEETVSYVNAPLLAAGRGISVTEEAAHDGEDFVSLLRVSGVVGDRNVGIAGSMVGRKGACLVEVLDYQIELPLSRYLLVVRNDDVPGIIGLVGTYLGDLQVNIADMVVGRSPAGEAAMMGISLDQPLDDGQIEGLRGLRGITDATFVDLS